MLQIFVLDAENIAWLDNVAEDVFDAAVDSQLLREFVADPRHHLVVAAANEQVVGMASAVDYIHPDKPRELWINEVGVAPTYQRRGIGRQLLQTLFALAADLSCRVAWVATEHDNIAARALYADAGGEEDPAVVVYTFDIKR